MDDDALGPWQGGSSWVSQSFIMRVKSELTISTIRVHHHEVYMGSEGALIDTSTSDTGNSGSISGSVGSCSRVGTEGSSSSYYTSFDCNLAVSPGNYQVTFDSTNGNSAFRSEVDVVENNHIGIYGYIGARKIRSISNFQIEI